MKNIYKLILLILSLFGTYFAHAQSDAFDRPLTPQSGEERLETRANSSRSVRGGSADAELKIRKSDDYPAKDIPKEYTGYRIEILVTDSLLAQQHEVFFRHGNIGLESLASNQFAYTVGDFQDAESATRFLQQFILPRYNEARIVSYQNGKRN
jgi:hypothetical protein